MKLLNELIVSPKKSVQLLKGDLTQLSDENKVDLLVVFTNKKKQQNKLVDSLNKKGVLLKKLSKDKAIDFRTNYDCWLSKKITSPVCNVERVLCFEQDTDNSIENEVKKLFKALTQIELSNIPLKNISIPLLYIDNQKKEINKMVSLLLSTASEWLKTNKTSFQVRIVAHVDSQSEFIFESPEEVTQN